MPDFPNQFSQFPDYLSGSSSPNLQRFQGQINGLYNFAPVQATGNAYINSNFDQQRASAAAMAAASQRRAMQSGGAVGSSFAQAGAMLPLYNQRNQQSFDLAKLQAQMKESQAGLMGQTAGMMDNNSMQRAAQQSQYGMGQQRMASENSQFDQTFGLQRDQLGLQRDQFGLQQRQFNASLMQRYRPQTSYNLDRQGIPASAYDLQKKNENDNWATRYAALQY